MAHVCTCDVKERAGYRNCSPLSEGVPVRVANTKYKTFAAPCIIPGAFAAVREIVRIIWGCYDIPATGTVKGRI